MSVSMPYNSAAASDNPLDAAPAPRAKLRVSLRGAVVAAFLLYLLNWPVAEESDVIASVLSYCMLTLGSIGVGATVVFGRAIRKSALPSVNASDGTSGSGQTGSTPCIYTLRIGKLSMPPLFTLTVRTVFEKGDPGLPSHAFFGSSLSERTVSEQVRFPHRGEWRIDHLAFRFGDQFGICSFSWKVSDESVRRSFRVHPPPSVESGLPILSSSHRAGEMVAEQTERLGDPFDLKQYHPSDGMKKIIWKIFARRGELIARHPEASVTPEGQVVVFVVAAKSEDDVCSDAVAYLSTLESMDLEIFFSCEGNIEGTLARGRDASEGCLIDCVWNTPCEASALKEDMSALVRGFRDSMRESRLERVLIFIGEQRIAKPGSADSLIALGGALEAEAAAPVFFVTRNAPAEMGEARGRPGARSILSRLMFEQGASSPSEIDRPAIRRFLAICAERQWQVII